MAAITENNYIGDGYVDTFPFNFQYINEEDVKAKLNDVDTTAYRLINATTVRFDVAPAPDVVVTIYRKTNTIELPTTFYSGSTITAKGLNDNFEQTLYVAQEVQRDQAIAISSSELAISANEKADRALEQSEAAQTAAVSAAADAAASAEAAQSAQDNAQGAIDSIEAAEAAAVAAQEAADEANAAVDQIQADSATAVARADAAQAAADAATAAADAATATANTALTDSAQALTDSATAIADASAAQTAATAAQTDAAAAVAAVASVTTYAPVADVAAIPASPSEGDGVLVEDTVGLEFFTPLTGLPAGFTGDDAVSVSLLYTGGAWDYVSTMVPNPDGRYTIDSTLAVVAKTGEWSDLLNAPPSTSSGSNPPADPVAGTSWFDADSGREYIWYVNEGDADNQGAWVDSSPATVPDTTGLVAVDGDNMTGDLTLGTDKITLDATDGSAEFTGNIVTKGFNPDIFGGFTDSDRGLKISYAPGEVSNTGLAVVTLDAQANTYDGALNFAIAGDVKQSIFADGSATFAGGYNNSTGLSILSTGSLFIRDDEASPVTKFALFKGGSTYGQATVRINNDGGASFLGNVGIGTASPEAALDVRGGLNLSSSTATDTVIQRYAAPSGAYRLFLTGGGGIASEGYPIDINDSVGGAVITLTGGPMSDPYGGGIGYYSNGSTSPDSNGTGNQHVFYTRSGVNTHMERMRITSTGNIQAGTTSTSGIFSSSLNSASAAAYFGEQRNGSGNGSCAIFNRSSSDGTLITFQHGGATEGSISVSGATVSYNTSSDYRLKENVVPLTGAVDRLKQLKPSKFNFIATPDKTVDGFLAHEAQAVVPESATGTKDEVDDEGNPVYQGIDQSKLVPLLTAALQEAIAKIESLETRISQLEAN